MEKGSSSDEPYIMKKNIIKFYSYYYIPFTLHIIKIITKLYLNLFLISSITSSIIPNSIHFISKPR